MPEFYMIFARKINKIPKFYTFARKIPEFYVMFARKKNIFSAIVWREGATTLLPVSYAYGWAPGLPPAKSGPHSIWDEIVVFNSTWGLWPQAPWLSLQCH